VRAAGGFSYRCVDAAELTGELFRRSQIVGEPALVPRPADTSVRRLAGQYALLAARVRERSTHDGGGAAVVGGELREGERYRAHGEDAGQAS
jgi:hypothetical protein